MNNVNYIFLLISILIINSILLDKKLNILKDSVIENYNQIIQDENIKNYEIELKKAQELSTNYTNLNNNQKDEYYKLLDYITGYKGRMDKENQKLIDEMIKRDPLNKFKKHKNLKCKNEQITILDTISLPNSSNAFIKRECANLCKNNNKCISFDYQDKKCRLSTYCYLKNSDKNNKSELYLKKGAKIPSITKFNLLPKKKISTNSNCRSSKLKDINNVDITKCADECIKNKNCVSWEHHKKDNLRYNVCKTYSQCYDYRNTITNDENSMVGLKHNVILRGVPNKKVKTLRTNPLN